MDPALVNWLITGGLGPAVVALPVNWTAGQLGRVAHRWFERLRRADGLSKLVRAAGISSDLTRHEFGAVRQLLRGRRNVAVAGQRDS